MDIVDLKDQSWQGSRERRIHRKPVTRPECQFLVSGLRFPVCNFLSAISCLQFPGNLFQQSDRCWYRHSVGTPEAEPHAAPATCRQPD
jgi:hypothetical protein